MIDLVDELRGKRFDALRGRGFSMPPQQETRTGILLRFLGMPCEFDTEDIGCAYPGLGWRCGHLRRRN